MKGRHGISSLARTPSEHSWTHLKEPAILFTYSSIHWQNTGNRCIRNKEIKNILVPYFPGLILHSFIIIFLFLFNVLCFRLQKCLFHFLFLFFSLTKTVTLMTLPFNYRLFFFKVHIGLSFYQHPIPISLGRKKKWKERKKKSIYL